MKGKIIAIEGVDGSGKETQSKRLLDKIQNLNKKVLLRGFPNYNSQSSALVKMYLNGDFGSNAKDVSPYIASTFYAVDRYASFMSDWKKDYDNGAIIILDRYTTANMVHQAGKIKDLKERDEYLKWLYDFEFNLYRLPVPDVTFFLDIPMEFRDKITRDRKNKINGELSQDIHERDKNHLKDAREAGLYVANKYSWQIINCVEEKEGNLSLRTIDDIGDEILNKVLEII